MKKKWLGLAVIPAISLTFALSGCGEASRYDMAKENMSEITYTYFYGKCDEFEMSISAGEREEPYSYDGVSQEKCKFALVVAKIDSKKEKEEFIFSINSDVQSQVLEYNIMTGTFMADLEKEIDSDDVINVKYGNSEITLECMSNNFAVDYNKAIEIGVNEFCEDMTSLTEQGELKAECYLKVLDNLSNGYDSRFWCFSIVDMKGQHLNAIIDTESGNVVART